MGTVHNREVPEMDLAYDEYYDDVRAPLQYAQHSAPVYTSGSVR